MRLKMIIHFTLQDRNSKRLLWRLRGRKSKSAILAFQQRPGHISLAISGKHESWLAHGNHGLATLQYESIEE